MSQEKRSRDLLCSIPFEDFLVKEIVPWALKNYHTSDDPRRIVVVGSSYGGLWAGCSALRQSEVFGNVLSQSGTFTWYPNWNLGTEDYAVESGWLARQFVAAPKLPVRFYMEAGRFEGRSIYSLLGENRRLRDILEAKGYQVSYREYSGGHDYATWRNSIGDGLIALIGD